MRVFANESELQAYKFACIDLGFGGVGRDAGFSSSTAYRIYKAGMDADVRLANVRERVLDVIRDYPRSAKKSAAAVDTAEKDDLGICGVAKYDSEKVKNRAEKMTDLICDYLSGMNTEQLGKMLKLCIEVGA